MGRFSTTIIGDGLGATVAGDLLAPLDAADAAELRDLFYRHYLLIFRGQHGMSEAQQDHVMSAFGTPIKTGPYDTEVITNVGSTRDRVIYEKNGKVKDPLVTVTLAWHSDFEFLRAPYDINALYSVDVVDGATGTDFANGARAWRLLSDETKARIEGLDALHVRQMDLSRRNRAAEAPAGNPSFASPLADTCEQTGTRFVSLSEMFIDSIVGLPEEESEAIIADMSARLYAEDNYHRHIWNSGDLVIWDNHVVQHRRPGAVKPDAIGNRVLRRSQVGKYSATELFAELLAGKEPVTAGAAM